MDTEPAMMPIIGSIPNAFGNRNTCSILNYNPHRTSKEEEDNENTALFEDLFKEAIKPMVVKKASIKKVCKEPPPN